ncbi:MAG: hypothetical protein K940chlam8_00857 [Chlamydiae bacterium]|nr:hypothetical protein [Chlamydiota bacterium]
MLKKAFLLTSIACFGFANQTTYSQNNLPSQHKVKGYVVKNHPILFNANLLIGQISASPVNYLQTIHTPPFFAPNLFFDFTKTAFPEKIDVGFRFGLGIGLDNHVNVSAQWTWFYTKDWAEKRFTAPTGGNLFIQIPIMPFDTPADGASFENKNAIAKAHQALRYQTLDFLAQTASWMLSSNIRFQPFGGIRLFYFKRDLVATLIDVDENTSATINNHFKLRGSGVLIGTDIKYLFSKRFFFFSNVMAGILGGYETRDLSANTNLTGDPLEVYTFTFHERFHLSFDSMYEVRLGFAFETPIRKQGLLSFYLAYEFSSMVHTQAKAIVPVAPVSTFDEINTPIRTNDVIKTQFGVLGATIAF